MEIVTPVIFMKRGEFSSMCPILLQKHCDGSVKFSYKEKKKKKSDKEKKKLIESISLFLALRIYFRQF